MGLLRFSVDVFHILTGTSQTAAVLFEGFLFSPKIVQTKRKTISPKGVTNHSARRVLQFRYPVFLICPTLSGDQSGAEILPEKRIIPVEKLLTPACYSTARHQASERTAENSMNIAPEETACWAK